MNIPDEKTYEEIVSEYTLEELYGVENRIDKSAHPERYQIVLDEIEKRKNGVMSDSVRRRAINSALEKSKNKKNT